MLSTEQNCAHQHELTYNKSPSKMHIGSRRKQVSSVITDIFFIEADLQYDCVETTYNPPEKFIYRFHQKGG